MLYHFFFFNVKELPLDYAREPLFDRVWETMLSHHSFTREPLLVKTKGSLLDCVVHPVQDRYKQCARTLHIKGDHSLQVQ
ncbi:hypothetical protein PI125_g6645 [Phytophthora idaei]|nr:hypothetical protein PI125_g6645 [Phytophthora idaei]KAG3161545.1 hypothetical protein PI126_g6384 [Phytophthora idaei]